MLIQEIINCLQDNYVILFIGFKNTLQIWIISAMLSLNIGFMWGLLREKRLFDIRITTTFNIMAYFIQGIPFYIEALIAFFIIGPLFSITNPLMIGSIALGFCSASYTSQIIKTGLDAIAKEQWDLTRNIGYTKFQTVYYIIIPQIIQYIIPLFINECDQLLKSISILATLGVLDFTRSGLNIINQTFKPIPIYMILLTVYLLCSLCLRYVAHLYNKNLHAEKILHDNN
jgi:His/Glu/Gln/Arg/opine family amino acid ABC transporter permease subunit